MCSFNELVSLEGAPEIVEGSFDCENNKLLKSLDYLPKGITLDNLISNFSEEEVYEFFRNDRPEVLI
jgi:hypothetical protein